MTYIQGLGHAVSELKQIQRVHKLQFPGTQDVLVISVYHFLGFIWATHVLICSIKQRSLLWFPVYQNTCHKTHSTSSLVPRPHSTSSLVPRPQSTSSLVPRPHSTSSLVSRPHSTSSLVPRSQSTSSLMPRPQSTSSLMPRPHSDSSLMPRPHSDSSLMPRPHSRMIEENGLVTIGDSAQSRRTIKSHQTLFPTRVQGRVCAQVDTWELEY